MNYNIRKNVKDINWPNKFHPVHRCNKLYKFLLHESPPLDSEVSPINRYALIIAVTLNQCYIFNYPNNDEEELQIKVKKWLNESGIKNNIYY